MRGDVIVFEFRINLDHILLGKKFAFEYIIYDPSSFAETPTF